MSRYEIDENKVSELLLWAEDKWNVKLVEKGKGIFVSSHEILGCLTEEVREFEEAVRKNDLKDLHNELSDILVIALHGLASIESQKMDWPKIREMN